MDTDDLFKLTVLTQYYFIALLHCFNPFSPVILVVSECPLLKCFFFCSIVNVIINYDYLAIIPRAFGPMGYWGHEGERNNCFRKIQLVDQKYLDKTTLASKTRFSRNFLVFKASAFRY